MFFKLIAAIAFMAVPSIVSAGADCPDIKLSAAERAAFQMNTGLTFSGHIDGKYLANYTDGEKSCSGAVWSLADTPRKMAELYRQLADPRVKTNVVAGVELGYHTDNLLLDIVALDSSAEFEKTVMDSARRSLQLFLAKNQMLAKGRLETETTNCRGIAGFTKVEVTLVTIRAAKRNRNLFLSTAYYKAGVHRNFSANVSAFGGLMYWQAFRNKGALRYPRSQVCEILGEFGTQTPAQRLLSGL